MNSREYDVKSLELSIAEKKIIIQQLELEIKRMQEDIDMLKNIQTIPHN